MVKETITIEKPVDVHEWFMDCPHCGKKIKFKELPYKAKKGEDEFP